MKSHGCPGDDRKAPGDSLSQSKVTNVWEGLSRPSPAELRSEAYDLEGEGVPASKIVICGSPRTASKRLARLMLAAGLGVPMEYFNPATYQELLGRWGIGTRDYLDHIFSRRSANGVFATNLQYRHLQAWPRLHDLEVLLDGAVVYHLRRVDRGAQAASLAACMLTGNWGFDGSESRNRFPAWRLQRAAKQALRLIEEDERGWAETFSRLGLSPTLVTDREIIEDGPCLVEVLANRVGVHPNRAGVERMIELDRDRYASDRELKTVLYTLIRSRLEPK